MSLNILSMTKCLNPRSAQAVVDLRFVWLEKEDWQGSVPADVNPSDKIFGYGMGYRHMCRFFTGPPLADHVALDGFDWLLRIDTDSFLLGPLTADPIAALADGNRKYGWVGAFKDEKYYVTGLWPLTMKWMAANRLPWANVDKWLEPHIGLSTDAALAAHAAGRAPGGARYAHVDGSHMGGPVGVTDFDEVNTCS